MTAKHNFQERLRNAMIRCIFTPYSNVPYIVNAEWLLRRQNIARSYCRVSVGSTKRDLGIF